MGDERSCISLAEELIVSIERFQTQGAETHPSGHPSAWVRAFPILVSVGESHPIEISPEIS